jgi:hypothetical protein
MIWQKVDPALASALEDVQDMNASQFYVLIQTSKNPGPSERECLEKLGVPRNSQGPIFTARVSANDIHALSDESWVRAVRLSRKLQVAV